MSNNKNLPFLSLPLDHFLNKLTHTELGYLGGVGDID
jgi:hypothetical protein